MITFGLIWAGMFGLYAVLRQLDSKPSVCPNCSARTLIADRDGVIWRCVPCEAQYCYLAGKLRPIYQNRPRGEEAVPTATLRIKDDSDKVES